MIYILLHYAFLTFHGAFVIFNGTGWIWEKTRKAHLITMCLTAFSWGILGFWFGWGYCFCTDWHWRILDKIGERPETQGYIHYLLETIFKTELDQGVVKVGVSSGFIFVIIGMIVVNRRSPTLQE